LIHFYKRGQDNLSAMWMQVVGAATTILIIYLIKSSQRPKKFPPGPRNIPLFGSLLRVDVRNLSKSFSRLSKKYGDIFSIYVGNIPVVVLNNYDLIKSTFERHEFSGRPGNFSGTFFQKGKTGITTTEGKHWKEQRGFLVEHIDNITGTSCKALEDNVLDEVSDMKVDWAKKDGETVAVSYKVNVGILNILWSITCGRKLHAQQQEFQAVYECIDKMTTFMSRAAIFSFLPVLTRLLPESVTSIERGRYYRNRFHEITEKWIREHRQEYRGNRIGDLQDAYLEKLNKGEETYSAEGLGAILRELFVIGAESESVLTRWALRLLSCHPGVQRRMQEEIDRVRRETSSKDVLWETRDKMPFSMAVIKEVQRFADIAPTGLLHKTLCDVSLSGFDLPQGTLVMANLSSCHRDTKYWSKPDQFHPQHFLTSEGELIEDKEGFLPYGIGKRMCPGAKLADMQVFLFLTNILADFDLKVPQGDKGDLGTQFKAGTSLLRNPKPFRVVVESRGK